jgi:predicted amidohydrolase
MIERDRKRVYDSGVLLDRESQVVLVQRKLSEKPPLQNGERVDAVVTELGKAAILICGDLFHTKAIVQLSDDLDWILVPMARAFAGQSPDKHCWELEERAEYVKSVKTTSKTAFLGNALDERFA